MSITRHRPRLYLTGLVTLLAAANALAPWGEGAALHGEAILQVGTGMAAIICGVVVARRARGVSRWWRLLYAAAMGFWLFGQSLWWIGGAEVGDSAQAVAGVAAFLLTPVLALASLVLLVRSSGVIGRPHGLLRHPSITSILDGVVSGLSFLILAAMGGFGTQSTAALPRSGNAAVEIVFAVAELLLVGTAVVIAMVYDPSRPYRMNYLLLAGGLVSMAVADRVVTYLRSVGAESAELWGGIGFILGPLMIAFAMLDNSPRQAQVDNQTRDIDWAQLTLPYIGFLSIAVLFAFHTLIGRPLGTFEVCATVLMVLLVTIRQVVAMRAQRLLTQRLYRAQRRLAYQLHHDPLTGLPNRILFTLCLDEAIRHGRFVLVFVDLDDFKDVNDRFGHAAGDELLCAVGDRLKRCVADNDTLARIGGDEFAILVDGVLGGEGSHVESVADRIRVALRDPFPVQGSSVRVRASMGVVAPGAEDEPQTSDDLLRQADVSMYAGKRLGKDTTVVYQPLTGVSADFPTALREAGGGVPAGFSLAFQPIVRLPEGTLVAVEALARWVAPNGMLVSPPTFVVAAEVAGLGAVLDAMVLDLACGEVVASGLSVDIHVNVGAARLGNSGFEQHVQRTLTRHRIAPCRLVLEITETVPIVDLAAAAAQIARFNALGVKVALDDFGAGYNSLTYLHALPVRVVKLDRSLAVGGDPARDVALYRSVVALCAELGFDVIAEGIETTAQADTVLAAGCRLAQGYLFGRAVPIGDVAERHPAFANGPI